MLDLISKIFYPAEQPNNEDFEYIDCFSKAVIRIKRLVTTKAETQQISASNLYHACANYGDPIQVAHLLDMIRWISPPEVYSGHHILYDYASNSFIMHVLIKKGLDFRLFLKTNLNFTEMNKHNDCNTIFDILPGFNDQQIEVISERLANDQRLQDLTCPITLGIPKIPAFVAGTRTSTEDKSRLEQVFDFSVLIKLNEQSCQSSRPYNKFIFPLNCQEVGLYDIRFDYDSYKLLQGLLLPITNNQNLNTRLLMPKSLIIEKLILDLKFTILTLVLSHQIIPADNLDDNLSTVFGYIIQLATLFKLIITFSKLATAIESKIAMRKYIKNEFNKDIIAEIQQLAEQKPILNSFWAAVPKRSDPTISVTGEIIKRRYNVA